MRGKVLALAQADNDSADGAAPGCPVGDQPEVASNWNLYRWCSRVTSGSLTLGAILALEDWDPAAPADELLLHCSRP